jgi:hypothetical protein
MCTCLRDLHAARAQGGANQFVPPVDVGVCGGNVGDLLTCPELEELRDMSKKSVHHFPIHQIKLAAIKNAQGMVGRPHQFEVLRPISEMVVHVGCKLVVANEYTDGFKGEALLARQAHCVEG